MLGWLLPKLNVIPVDQEGGDRSALKALIRILRANQGTLVFPEGARTLDGNLQPPQNGIGFVIAKTLAPVVPMRIFGAHEALPRGGGRLRLCPITIVVGEPLRFTAADVEGSGREVYPRLSAASDGRDRRAAAGIARALRRADIAMDLEPARHSSRAPASGLKLMLVILVVFALLAGYGQWNVFGGLR